MPDRFFLEAPPDQGQAVLTGPEAHHLAHVLRAKPGQAVVVFDGSGQEWDAQIREVGRSQVRLTVLASRTLDRELTVPLVLGVGLPRGDRQRGAVERAVELGVTRLVPLIAERSVAEITPAVLQRLRRGVIDAAKQCGRNRLMTVDSPLPCATFFAAAPPTAAAWIAHPGREAASALALAGALPPDRHQRWIAIGPEGGFTEEELALARRHHWSLLDLGPRILRVETAIAAVAALVSAGDPGMNR